MNKTTLEKFKTIYLLEGISYILLLFVAVPLKYMYEMPIATKIAGPIHGILFILFLIYFSQSIQQYKFDKKFSIKLFISSLIPFANFFVSKKLEEYKNK